MSGFRLVVDPIACDGHGVCAELFPEGLSLDDWGYPLLARPGRSDRTVGRRDGAAGERDGVAGRPGEVSVDLLAHARRAVSACPNLALRLVRSDAPARRTTRQ